MRQLAKEFSPTVRVNAISPGAVKTFPGVWSSELEAEHNRQHLLGRTACPAEIASAAVFLASEESSFVHGHDLVVDGGASIDGE